ncbi:MAG TPA: hypothetical protein VMR16_02375 [Candidatus Saccharimonadales bacterium]|nr:hypothetical protein [Candidatus Saccharimonadales bacterium]
MSTPATLKQGRKLLDLVSGSTCEEMQNLLGAGDLIKQIMACPDPSRVDKSAFAALLATVHQSQSSIPWTPVGQYVDRIMARSQSRAWGFTPADANKLNAKLRDHDGPLTPTGVSIWLGDNLSYNWVEMLAWIKDEVEKLGFTFQDNFSFDRLSFYPGSEVTGKRKLDVVDLDLATFWDSTNGVIPRKVRPTRPKWPGLKVATLLALNPQVYVAMDGETIPYMLAPGLVVYSDDLPGFYRFDRVVYVTDSWDGAQGFNTSVVASRE